jgi:3-deoxy-7-phosphoheptulonate synthase
VILRGGKAPNYDAASVEARAKELAARGPRAAPDGRFLARERLEAVQAQLEVGADVAAQLASGDERIVGVMVESHLNAGRQDLVPGRTARHGVSITDPCLGWEDTERCCETLAQGVRRAASRSE